MLIFPRDELLHLRGEDFRCVPCHLKLDQFARYAQNSHFSLALGLLVEDLEAWLVSVTILKITRSISAV